jgi:signal transduction histidine kinase
MRRALILVALAALAGTSMLWAQTPGSGAAFPDSIFLAPIADHFLDRSGAKTIEAVAAEADGVKFRRADGRVPNYGVRPTPTSALWLRIPIPKLDTATPIWTFSLNTSRIQRTRLYVPHDGTWSLREWVAPKGPMPGIALMRYPWIDTPANEVSGRTVFLRIETPSSMRALLWLEPHLTFVADYATQTLLFGVLFGVLAVLFIYLTAIGVALRELSLLALAVMVLSYLGYVFSDKSFLETLVFPGALTLSRIFSGPGVYVLYPAGVLFELLYLRTRQHLPLITKFFWLLIAIHIAIGISATLDLLAGTGSVRWLTSYVGATTYELQVVLALIMLFYEPRRVIAFLLCWAPRYIAGNLHVLADAFPALGTSPWAINATYFGMGTSLILFAILVSLDLQARERRLRAAVQASEGRFRSFAGSASDSFWETNRAGQLTYRVGPASETAGMVAGARLSDALAAIVSPNASAAAAIRAALERHTPFRAVTVPVTGGDGQVRHIALSGTPVVNADGAFEGFRGIVSDVTAETERREREAQQQKMAAVGQLASGVAHEINNMLHPIINLTRRVASSLPSKDEQRRYLDIVTEAGVRAGEIVAGLLATARPSADEKLAMDLSEGTRRAAEAIRPMIPDSVRFEVAIAGAGGPRVQAGEVFQVLSNLIANAIYATGGAGSIVVRFERDAAAGKPGACVLAVEDDGPGMDAETRQRALEPFFTTKSPGQGTGLGLPIVYGIVRGWGGSIALESELGRGTRVVIRWPAEATG